MIDTKRYFIHIDNKSVVPWTSEIEGNYKFKEITIKIAMAIENGKISADEVVSQISRQIQIRPATLEQMLDAKLKMNVREGELNLESQVKKDNSQRDTGEATPFDIIVPGGTPGGDKPEKTDKQLKKNGKPVEKPDKTPVDHAKIVTEAQRADGGAAGVVNV